MRQSSLNNRNVAFAAAGILVILAVGIFVIASPGAQKSGSSSSTTAPGTSSTSSAPSTSTSSSSSIPSPTSGYSSSSATPSTSSSSSKTTTTSTATSSSSSSTSSNSKTSSSSSSTTTAPNGYYFLVFTQKGVAELTSTDGTILGYSRLFNISDSVPTQAYYWEGYPVQGAGSSNILVPLNNGTIEVVNSTQMKVTSRFSIGSATGFIGVAISPDEKYAALVDGPSGVVEVVNLATVQTVWKQVFNGTTGASAYPCDITWSPDGSTIVIPMRTNGTVDVVSATTGNVVASTALPIASQPFMLSVNTQGSMLGVELGNKTVAFYSYPALNLLGKASFPISTFSPVRGVFTQDGKYYLEASSSTNVIEVISTSTFAVANTISLPSSASPGLGNMEITPDGLNAYVVEHGTPTTGGIIYLIPLANVATTTGPSGSIPLTTAPAFAIPISIQFGTYLADNVLLPPVTGLHC